MSCRKAFGKTSATLPNDIDFFVPDTGPLNAESYKARLVTSNGTQQVKLPQSGVVVRYAYVSQRGCDAGNPHPPFLLHVNPCTALLVWQGSHALRRHDTAALSRRHGPMHACSHAVTNTDCSDCASYARNLIATVGSMHAPISCSNGRSESRPHGLQAPRSSRANPDR